MMLAQTKAAIRERLKRERAIQNGLCPRCARNRPIEGRVMCEECSRKRRKENGITWKGRRERNPANCCNCFIYPRMGSGALCERCFRLKAKERHRLKSDIIRAYGGKCACCGESILHFLTIDHVNGFAAEARDNLRVRGPTLYRRLRTLNYPDGFQVLCMSCNWAKGVFGICPHQGEFPKIDDYEITPRQKQTISATSKPAQNGMTLVDVTPTPPSEHPA